MPQFQLKKLYIYKLAVNNVLNIMNNVGVSKPLSTLTYCFSDPALPHERPSNT